MYTTPQIPEIFRGSAVVLLQYDTHLEFLHGSDGNRVKRRDTQWLYVNRTTGKGLERVTTFWSDSFERPVKINATAYLPDGSQWLLNPDDIKTVHDPFSNSVSESFHIPGYDSGAVIQLVIDREYLHPEFYGRFLFSSDFPTITRVITMSYPEDATLHYGVKDGQKLEPEHTVSSGDGVKTLSLHAVNVEKTKKHSATPYPEDYYSALHVSFPPEGMRSYSWQELGDHYLELSQDAFFLTEPITNLAAQITAVNPFDIISESFYTIVTTVRYHGDWIGRYAFYPREAADILNNGYGDCKELTTLLKTMLQAKGVDSHLVLLATWNNFQPLPQYANLANFNHAILAVKEDTNTYRFLDATHSWATAENSYYDSVGRVALILEKGNSRLYDIQPDKYFVNRVETQARLFQDDIDNSWRIKGTVKLIGYPGLDFFERLKYSNDRDDLFFAQRFLNRNFDIPADRVTLPELTPGSVTLGFTASYQQNYLSMEKGGFRLAVPGLYRPIVNDDHAEVAGDVYKYNFQQIDRWVLPYTPATEQTTSFTNDIAQGSWENTGNRIIRRYKQNTIKIQGNSPRTEHWYHSAKTFTHSYFWK